MVLRRVQFFADFHILSLSLSFIFQTWLLALHRLCAVYGEGVKVRESEREREKGREDFRFPRESEWGCVETKLQFVHSRNASEKCSKVFFRELFFKFFFLRIVNQKWARTKVGNDVQQQPKVLFLPPTLKFLKAETTKVKKK